MTGVHSTEFVPIVLMVGLASVVAMLIKAGLSRTVVPALVGYLGLGMALKLLQVEFGLLPEGSESILQFLAKVGLVCLLFNVGLQSDIKGLFHQLRNAAWAWAANIAVAALTGYALASWLLGFGLIPSLIVATAFTATSVGITVSVWQEAGAIRSKNGALLVDLAELDDVTAILLMALLFAMIPVLQGGGGGSILGTLSFTAGFFLLKLLFFGGLCYLFARYLEGPVTRFLRRKETLPDTSLSTVGIGLVIAALAGLLGFSLAIGAFFAGLVFSRDQGVVEMEKFFAPVFDLFAPFFFIGIGLDIDPAAMVSALWMGTVLLGGAAISKILANGLPVYFMRGLQGGLLIGVSMVPRAEITMIIMQKGLRLGEWAVTPRLYGAMVLVTLLTAVLAPVAARTLLRSWPQENQ